MYLPHSLAFFCCPAFVPPFAALPHSSPFAALPSCLASFCCPAFVPRCTFVVPWRRRHQSCAQSILKVSGDEVSEYCTTFVIGNEDHTLGNSLRHLLMKEYVKRARARVQRACVACVGGILC